MASNMEDDYGGLDDEDMMLAAEEIDRERAHKRRRITSLNDKSGYESDDRQRAEQRGDDDRGQKIPEQISQPRHINHISKLGIVPLDCAETQLPDSQSPYWVKRAPPHVGFKQQQGTTLAFSSRKVDSTLEAVRQLSRPSHQGSIRVDHRNEDSSIDDTLPNLPSDAFSSSTPRNGASIETLETSSQYESHRIQQPHLDYQQPFVKSQTNLRQATLFGGRTQESDNSLSQSSRKHNWPMKNREEAPTHHKLEEDELRTWVYPTNLGKIRDYQFSIVARGLYQNLLVALPTGLGKTFIAATIMLNWFRWTKDAQIVFVAPTKPLVSQQVDACFNIAGIPRSATSMLTGGISPGIRAEEWSNKRVFFMTPQTIMNDLKTGICDPKRVVLIVVDEAHRATGAYAYVEVVKFLRRFNTSFRVLALTATPGSSVETVQEVIDGLGISKVEIRTEESIDIRQYVHPRKIDTVLFEYSEEMTMVMDLFSKALQPVVNKLNGMNAYWAKDPMTLTPYGCTLARKKWMLSDAGKKAHVGMKNMVNSIFTILASLGHAIELLKFHGIGPFFNKVTDFRSETQNHEKAGKYRKDIIESDHFMQMMSRLSRWTSNKDFVGHPKLEYLQSVVLNHFMDAGEGRGVAADVSPASTRIMVFVHYRDSAEEVSRVLGRNETMIRPHVFVGQANSKGSGGMDQKTQLDIIQKFKSGIYNTLVATSIGEEGLDIGEVDLIVCYDASASPIRMLQRMGRTGRKRAGNIVVTLMKGKEEDNFVKAKDNYEKMQQMIAEGSRFTFHEDLAPRIVPRNIQPIVDKRMVDIPLENTQAELPVPKKRAKAPKRPPKKFHMPDGVRTGFTKASKIDESEDAEDEALSRKSRPRKPEPEPESIPTLESVVLTSAEMRDLERRYLDIGGDDPEVVEFPRLDAFPNDQRALRKTKHVKHGRVTRRVVALLNRMHGMTEVSARKYKRNLTPSDRRVCEAMLKTRTAFLKGSADEVLEDTDVVRHDFSSPPPAKPANHNEASVFLESSSLSSRRKQVRNTMSRNPRRQISKASSYTNDMPGIGLDSMDSEMDEDGHDDGQDLGDFINDSDDDEGKSEDRRAPSPISSTMSMLETPFYEPSKLAYDLDDDEDEDLLELDKLMAINRSAKAPDLVEKIPVNDISRNRKGKRIVVDSDSDE